jgi:hypothetical protein
MQDIIDAEAQQHAAIQQQKKVSKMKMVYHFPRVEATDIPVEGDSEGQCLDKALAERAKMCKPVAVKGEIVE